MTNACMYARKLTCSTLACFFWLLQVIQRAQHMKWQWFTGCLPTLPAWPPCCGWAWGQELLRPSCRRLGRRWCHLLRHRWVMEWMGVVLLLTMWWAEGLSAAPVHFQ
jgi:hypothetical protein